MKNFAAVIAAVMVSLVLIPVPSNADTGLPECATITSLNCQGTFVNRQAGEGFVQIVGGTGRYESYWPFRNPTVNFHGALQQNKPDAFPSDYKYLRSKVYSCQQEVKRLRTVISDRDATIKRLKARIAYLESR